MFEKFNEFSENAGKWLVEHRRVQSGSSSFQDILDGDHDNPRFVDALLDISQETRLLAEIKDIRDELNIISTVLEYQGNVLKRFGDNIVEEIGGKRSKEAGEVYKRSKEQLEIIRDHIQDLTRMDKQSASIYDSLTDLLDLKQKHANAFEARFARDQASLTAKQGKTIMIFTV